MIRWEEERFGHYAYDGMRMEAASCFSLAPLLRGRDERSSLLEGWGEGLPPRMSSIDRPVPPHPDRIFRCDPTSPRKRGEVKKKSYRPSIAAIIQPVILLVARKSSAARCSSSGAPLPCTTATSRSQRRETATPIAVCRKPLDILRS